jgi:lysozyme
VQPVAGDAWTVGFGTTGTDIGPSTTTTPPQALVRLLRDVHEFEGALHRCVTVPLHQHEYDAYLSLAYNIGAGAFCGSTLVKLLNGRDYAAACEQIKRWDKFKGKPLRGLTLRRQREYAQCVGTELT